MCDVAGVFIGVESILFVVLRDFRQDVLRGSFAATGILGGGFLRRCVLFRGVLDRGVLLRIVCVRVFFVCHFGLLNPGG